MKLARRIAILEKKLASETGVGTIKKHNGKFTVDFGMDEFYMLDISRLTIENNKIYYIYVSGLVNKYISF